MTNIDQAVPNVGGIIKKTFTKKFTTIDKYGLNHDKPCKDKHGTKKSWWNGKDIEGFVGVVIKS